MQEALLHHIWRYKKFQLSPLETTSREEIQDEMTRLVKSKIADIYPV